MSMTVVVLLTWVLPCGPVVRYADARVGAPGTASAGLWTPGTAVGGPLPASSRRCTRKSYARGPAPVGRGMYQVTPVVHTGPVTTPPLAARIRAALAPLWRPAPPAPDGDPRRLSRWAWVADAVLAVFLAATTVYATANG